QGLHRKGRTRCRAKKCGNKGTSSDSDTEEDSEDTCEDLNTPYKRPKPAPFTTRITHFKYYERPKIPRNVKVRGAKSEILRRILAIKEVCQGSDEDMWYQKKDERGFASIYGSIQVRELTHQGCATCAMYLGIYAWLRTSRAGQKAQ
ncbi:hypothetical protein Tco_0160694, partial [Tanacetum coccineum]